MQGIAWWLPDYGESYHERQCASLQPGPYACHGLQTLVFSRNCAPMELLSTVTDQPANVGELQGGGPRVVVSTAAFHARVRGSVPGLGGLKETKMFLPHPRVKVSIVGSLRDREVACSASDRQGSNFKSCVWRTVSSQSSQHPQEVLLAQFSLYVHKGGLKPDSFHLESFKSSLTKVDPAMLTLGTTDCFKSAPPHRLLGLAKEATAQDIYFELSTFYTFTPYDSHKAHTSPLPGSIILYIQRSGLYFEEEELQPIQSHHQRIKN